MDIQWSLVLFTTLAGGGAWLSVCLGFNEVVPKAKDASTKMVAAVVALVLIVAGGLASVTHLSHPDRIMAALGHPTSGIFMEALFVGLVSLALIILIVMLKRGASLKAIGVVVGVLGLVMTFVLGYSYMMEARAAWNTVLMPLGYMFTAAPLGIGLWAALCAAKKEEASAVSFAGTLTAVAGIIAAVVVVAYGFVSGAAVGEQAALLWAAALAGGILPAICGFMMMKKPAQGVALGSAAAVLAVVGCLGFRCLMWLVGTGVDNFFGLI